MGGFVPRFGPTARYLGQPDLLVVANSLGCDPNGVGDYPNLHPTTIGP